MHCFQHKCVFAFYSNIQDGHQNTSKNNLEENDSRDTNRVKNFVEFALSHTVININAFNAEI